VPLAASGALVPPAVQGCAPLTIPTCAESVRAQTFDCRPRVPRASSSGADRGSPGNWPMPRALLCRAPDAVAWRVRCSAIGQRSFPRRLTGSPRVCAACYSTSTRSRLVRGTRVKRYERPGDYGDGLFCGLRCGYCFAVALAPGGRRLAPKKPLP